MTAIEDDAPMRTIFVTGGAGFIGSCFVRRWLDARLGRVVNLDKLTYAGHRSTLQGVLDNPDHHFVHGDITDGALVRQLLNEHRPQAMVHFAAESHVDRSIDAPAAFVTTNVVGTCTLLDAALEYHSALSPAEQADFRFLQVSTDEVFGSLPAPENALETARYAPNSPYAASKAAADHFVRAYHATYGLPVLVTTCSNNYGPYQFPEKLIPVIIDRALAAASIPIYGDGQQVRDWLHVEDHCRALEMILARGAPGDTFNIASGESFTNVEIAHMVCDGLDELCPAADGPRRELISFVADRPGHDRRYALDATKLRTRLNWQPQVAFADGIRRTVAWYLDNAAWVKDVTAGQPSGRLGLARASRRLDQ
jgi:dTDP-glucose 4,6-dehydratase